ncbi:MAG: GNAT family N-acetyltransferase [Bacteroidetes bacterium]|nr:GNAT family N-acetyltransferase [Bacteroidota bacterium]
MNSKNLKVFINKITENDLDSWLKMGLKLWPDCESGELSQDLRNILESSNQKSFMAKNEEGEAIGFVNVSVRVDYVEGAKKSPTGYLEGIFVEEKYRKNGVAQALIKAGEDWLKQNNCTQIGSDTWLSNIDSQKFHEKLGFHEEEKLVHYLKEIR